MDGSWLKGLWIDSGILGENMPNNIIMDKQWNQMAICETMDKGV